MYRLTIINNEKSSNPLNCRQDLFFHHLPLQFIKENSGLSEDEINKGFYTAEHVGKYMFSTRYDIAPFKLFIFEPLKFED